MKRLHKLLALALTGGMLATSAACGAAGRRLPAPDEEGKLVVSVAYDSQPDSVTGIIASTLANMLEEKSGGKITAHVYPSGQLGSDKELIQSCISGDVEFVVQNHSAQVNDITGAKVLDMPYLFPNIDIAREALDDPEFRGVYDALYPEVGLKLLMISDMGYRQTSSSRKLETLEDFKGLDIRTMENPIHIELWKALGANPTPMNRGEVVPRLAAGPADGAGRSVCQLSAQQLSGSTEIRGCHQPSGFTTSRSSQTTVFIRSCRTNTEAGSTNAARNCCPSLVKSPTSSTAKTT